MTATTLQQQARALGDPTRYAIFRYLGDAGAPVGVAELTGHLGLNHNAIRQHLAKLVAAGLVTGSTDRSGGRGRPRLAYELSGTAESRWGTTGPYERLSVLLTEVIATGDTPIEVGRRAGRRLRLDPSTGDGATDMARTMERQGFEPDLRRSRGRTEVVLQHCPFASAAVADRDTVCALHLGIAEGVAEDSDVTVDELVTKDPRRAGCRLRLTMGAA